MPYLATTYDHPYDIFYLEEPNPIGPGPTNWILNGEPTPLTVRNTASEVLEWGRAGRLKRIREAAWVPPDLYERIRVMAGKTSGWLFRDLQLLAYEIYGWQGDLPVAPFVRSRWARAFVRNVEKLRCEIEAGYRPVWLTDHVWNLFLKAKLKTEKELAI